MDEYAVLTPICVVQSLRNTPSRNKSVVEVGEKEASVEKIGEEDDGRFNLRDFLQSSNDANQNAGLKHKHVGVTWDDLEVDVIGGADFKVS